MKKEVKTEECIAQFEEDPMFDYIHRYCSVDNYTTNDEEEMYYRIFGFFEDELYTPKEKDFLDLCVVYHTDDSKNQKSKSTFRFWKADCYLQIKNILKENKSIDWIMNRIMFCVDNFCRKIGYDGLKCYMSYNGKKLEVKLVFNYLNKDKHEIELFVFTERPYSDVMRIVPLSI